MPSMNNLFVSASLRTRMQVSSSLIITESRGTSSDS
jgi:hypothetical protein